MMRQTNGHKSAPDLHSLVANRFARSTAVPEQFFTAEADNIAQACWAMAKRFHRNGRLIAFGNGSWASDAQHVSVEFVHPVIVGKRALPALALTNDSAMLSGLSGHGLNFAHQLRLLGRPQDMAMGFFAVGNGRDANVLSALAEAKEMGLLTLGLTNGSVAQLNLDFCFAVPDDDLMIVQETHETVYHILWELVHIFFEHEGLLV
jgi:D-sedoheptulose 7-phosphate isomerase